MYDLTPIGNNLFTCDKCGVVVKSGLMNIYRHSLVCGTVKTWPIDPNAPKNTAQDWINKGYKLVVVGGGLNKAYSRAWQDIYKHIAIGSDVIIHHSPEIPMDMLVEHVARINGGIGDIGPIPITPLPELKELSNQVYIKEDNRNWFGRVTPREQKNRERFNKKGRK